MKKYRERWYEASNPGFLQVYFGSKAFSEGMRLLVSVGISRGCKNAHELLPLRIAQMVLPTITFYAFGVVARTKSQFARGKADVIVVAVRTGQFEAVRTFVNVLVVVL